VNTTIDMQAWCDPEVTRFTLDKPFALGGWLYAASGCAMIRVPTDEPDSAGRFPGVTAIFAGIEDDGGWQSWPEIIREEYRRKCDACNGSGKETEDCEECDGRGDDICGHCGQTTDCDACGGIGTISSDVPCQTCQGTKNRPLFLQVVGEGTIDSIYDDRVRSLPNPSCRWHTGDRLLVRFDGGEAAIMRRPREGEPQ
jgi:hypothetical protein